MPVTGLDKIAAELRKLPKDVRGKRLDNAVRAAAVLVRDRAINTFVPVDTGRLRESITTVKGRQESTVENSVYHVGTKKKTAWYAHIVEEGTSNPNYPAQAFLRPAMEVEFPHSTDVMAEKFRKMLKLK